MKGGKQGRARRSAGPSAARSGNARGKPKKGAAKRAWSAAPKKGAKKPQFGGRPSSGEE